jgi:hypothetical protein
MSALLGFVNINAPNMGSTIFGVEIEIMHLIGLDHVSSFLRACSSEAAQAVLALVSELKHRNWRSAEEMARDFREAEFDVPLVTYWLHGRSVVMRCWVDFKTGSVLVENCEAAASRDSARRYPRIRGTAR